MRRAVCPGSFDPVTNGHIDIISRASQLFDEVVVAVGINASKSRARLFTAEERMAMLEKVCADFPNVTVAGGTTPLFTVTNTDASLPTANQGGTPGAAAGDYAYSIDTTTAAGPATSRAALELVPTTAVDEAAAEGAAEVDPDHLRPDLAEALARRDSRMDGCCGAH